MDRPWWTEKGRPADGPFFNESYKAYSSSQASAENWSIVFDIFSLKVDMNGFKPVLTDFDSKIPWIKFNLFTYPEFEFFEYLKLFRSTVKLA